VLYEKVGIVRRESELEEALAFVKECQQNLPKMGAKDNALRYNTNLIEFLEFRNMLDVSEAVITGALKRKESVGAHFLAEE